MRLRAPIMLNPHRRGGRRLDLHVRRQQVPRRPRQRRRQSGAGRISPWRPADRDRLQRDGRQAAARAVSRRVRPGRRPAARRRRRAPSSRSSRPRSPCDRTEDARGDRGGLPAIAVENMANAIKHISVERGYDVTGTLTCFGGAGGQHACLSPTRSACTRVYPPVRGVLSAYGMGLADVRALRQRPSKPLSDELLAALGEEAHPPLGAAPATSRRRASRRRRCAPHAVALRYDGTDTTIELPVTASTPGDRWSRPSRRRYRQRYGFLMPGRALVIEAVGRGDRQTQSASEAAPRARAAPGPLRRARRSRAGWTTPTARTGVYAARICAPATCHGPAIIKEPIATTVVEPGWRALVTPLNHLVLERTQVKQRAHAIGTTADPVLLEGVQQPVHGDRRADGRRRSPTPATSVNIKERLDFRARSSTRGQPRRQRAAHAGAPRARWARASARDPRKARRPDEAGRRLRAQRAVRRRHHLPDVTGGDARFLKGESSPLLYARAAIMPTSAASTARLDAAVLEAHQRRGRAARQRATGARGIFLEDELTAIPDPRRPTRCATSRRTSPTCARRSPAATRARPSWPRWSSIRPRGRRRT